MSLDISLVETQPVTVHSSNITHNLSKMARELGVYYGLWREFPCAEKGTLAKDLILHLHRAIRKLEENDDDYYKKFDAENGWGTTDDFLVFLKELKEACLDYPDAKVVRSK